MRQGWLVFAVETEEPHALFSFSFLFCQEVSFCCHDSEKSLQSNMKCAFWELNVLCCFNGTLA